MKKFRKLILLALMVASAFAATLTPRPAEADTCYCITPVFNQCCKCDPRTAKVECDRYCGC